MLNYDGKLPDAPQAFYYDACFERFSQIPLSNAYKEMLQQLKKRNKINSDEYKKVPYELKSLIYFSQPSEKLWNQIDVFLKSEAKPLNYQAKHIAFE